MLLESIKLINFRQFKGTSCIRFSCNPEQNVTIILGDNTYGKTTLLQAFSWCFYGTVTFDRNPEFLLNLEISNEMIEGAATPVEVELVLRHRETEYVITRSQEYVCKNGVVRPLQPLKRVSYKQSDGQMQCIKDTEIDNVINSMLPEDLSPYFFFDTERVRNISRKPDVADAVKGLLGLSALDNAIRHLGSQTAKRSVIGRLCASMDLEGDRMAEEALIRMQEAHDKQELIASQMKACLSEIKHYEDRAEQLREILRDNQETSSLQRRKEALERLAQAEIEAREAIVAEFLGDFSRDAVEFYSRPLLEKARDLLREAEVDDKGIKDLTAAAIMEIIKRGRCICGEEVVEGSPAFEHLKNELRFVPPESIGNAIRNYTEQLGSFGSAFDHILAKMRSRYEAMYRCKMRIQECNDEIEDISDKIRGKDSVRQYEQELADIGARLHDLQDKKEMLIREDEACRRSAEQSQKAHDSKVATSEKNKRVKSHIMYAEEIRDWFRRAYEEREDLIRDELETRVNCIFAQMYHGSRRVAINRNYQVALLSSVADTEMETGESEGVNRVKNFAFIAGLVALAKEKILDSVDSGSLDLPAESYPLVMDAPFSNADETHTANISRVLPEVAEQVIMFVMQKDWRYAEPVMKHRVGRRYMLDKLSETFTELKEV